MVNAWQVVERIGEMPIGDPAGMRAYAGRLQAEAAAISQRAQTVTSTVDGARYESPAANALRDGAGSTGAGLQAAANRLITLADDILRGAQRIEEEQGSWRAEFDRVLHDLEQRL
jgi:hypothetical protein